MIWFDIDESEAVDHLSEEELKKSLAEYVQKLVREDLKKWEDGRPDRIAKFEGQLRRWHEEAERSEEERKLDQEKGLIRTICCPPNFKPSPPRPKIQDRALELMHSGRLYLAVNFLPLHEPQAVPPLTEWLSQTGRVIFVI